jgi:hypothetical protein
MQPGIQAHNTEFFLELFSEDRLFSRQKPAEREAWEGEQQRDGQAAASAAAEREAPPQHALQQPHQEGLCPAQPRPRHRGQPRAQRGNSSKK